MYNRDNREIRNSEVNRETYQDAQGNTHTRVTRNADTVHTPRPTVDDPAYRDGYVSGQVTERESREENQIVRDNDNAARGLLLGVILTSVLGLIIGTLFFLNQRQEAPAPIAPVIVPNRSAAPAASPSPSPTTKTETRIIERDRVVPVPQPQSPAPQAPAPTVNVAPPPAPNVNVTVPSNPAPTSTQPQVENDSTSTQDTTGTTTNTAPTGSSVDPDNQSVNTPTTNTPATAGTGTTGSDTTGTGTGTTGTTNR
jgi:hypothetical protein